MNNYSYILIGGDKRQEYLYNFLKKDTENVERIFSDDDIAKLQKIDSFDVIVLPIPSTTDGENLFCPKLKEKIPLKAITEKISSKSILFTGGENSLFTASKAKKIINLLENDAMTYKNAMATAEAALSILIANTDYTIFDSSVLIIGYGRIASILVDYLTALKAKVSVCARKELARAEATINGAYAFGFDKLRENLKNYKIIVNTVPSVILKYEELKLINKGALIVDLASKPGGVDFDKADKIGLKTIHALSLPGKYSPKTAAEFIKEAINNTLT